MLAAYLHTSLHNTCNPRCQVCARFSLLAQGQINLEAYQYSQELLKVAEQAVYFETDKEESERKKKVRDQGFRRAIITLYSHRCALCGIRMLTPEGHTIVEAAHIKPWSISYDDLQMGSGRRNILI